MANKKKNVYKTKPITEGKRNPIQGLLQEYEIETYQNISLNELRIIAIKDALEDKNYDEAEKLCLEKANAEDTWHYHSSDPEDWNNMLYDIYKKANNTEKQIAQLIKWRGAAKARELIEELKQTYPRRPALLDELEKVEKKL